MFKSLTRLFSSSNDRVIKKMMVSVNKINSIESEVEKNPESYFHNLKDELHRTYKDNNEQIDSILPLAFAATR